MIKCPRCSLNLLKPADVVYYKCPCGWTGTYGANFISSAVKKEEAEFETFEFDEDLAFAKLVLNSPLYSDVTKSLARHVIKQNEIVRNYIKNKDDPKTFEVIKRAFSCD